MIYSYAPKIPAREAQRDFPVPRAKFRLRSTCSARTAWEFAKLPFCSAKPRFLRLTPIHPLKSRSAPQRRDFIALRGHAPRRAKRRGIFPSHEPSFAYAQLARQEPLGSLQNSHFAPQNRASCGLPLSHPYHRTGPEKTPLKTPVSERSERIGVFPVLPGHGPRSAPQRRDFIAPRGHAPRPRAYGSYTTPSSAVQRRVPYLSSIS